MIDGGCTLSVSVNGKYMECFIVAWKGCFSIFNVSVKGGLCISATGASLGSDKWAAVLLQGR